MSSYSQTLFLFQQPHHSYNPNMQSAQQQQQGLNNMPGAQQQGLNNMPGTQPPQQGMGSPSMNTPTLNSPGAIQSGPNMCNTASANVQSGHGMRQGATQRAPSNTNDNGTTNWETEYNECATSQCR